MSNRFVYFDLGNVLVHFDHEIGIARLSNITQQSSNNVRRVIFESDLQIRFETGKIDGDQFAEEVNRGLQSQIPTAEILEAISAIFQPNLEILPVLEFVRSQGIPMGILSNTCDAHWHWIVGQKWPMPGDWFRETMLSFEVRSMKPDAEIYQACESAANCEGTRIFFTDDRAENIAGAAQRNWVCCLYESPQSLQRSLERWLAS